MQLSNKVRQTYFDRFDEMDLEYRLHFASRLYAWSGDDDAKRLLDTLRPAVLPATHESRKENLFAIKEELRLKDYERDVNDYVRRKPYFEKYPNLLLLHSALFRLRHWLCIYGIDERSLLYELLPKQDVITLINELLADTAAQKTLSTYFINTVYLYEKLYDSPEINQVEPRQFIEIAKLYNQANTADIQILIYLYTHCILGETLFYFQPIQQNHDVYVEMIKQLEQLIHDNFTAINLDNKFEFLVCAQICDYKSFLTDRIYEEADKSVNDEGFIVDVHNTNKNPHKQSFMMSEHRNVLFIMSTTKPLFNKSPQPLLRFN